MSTLPAPDAVPSERLRSLAQKLLASGKLPKENPSKEWVGASSGATCALCYGAILEPCAEYTLEFAEHGPSHRPQTLHFHVSCRDLWNAERTSHPDEAQARDGACCG
jgi:hypothetical protein